MIKRKKVQHPALPDAEHFLFGTAVNKMITPGSS